MPAGRDDVVEEIRKTTHTRKSASAELGASVFEKAKLYVGSCLKCSFKMAFGTVYELVATDEAKRAETLEQAECVVQEFQTAFKVLLQYAINLLDAHQKKGIRKINLSSSFYSHRVSNKLVGAQKVLIHMGYQLTTNGQELVYEGDINRDAIFETAADLVILHAMLEKFLEWLRIAKEHGKDAKLIDIINYCKIGFSHGKISEFVTQNTSENKHKGGGNIQQSMPHQCSTQHAVAESQNSSQQGRKIPGGRHEPEIVENGTLLGEKHILRQTSWPDRRDVDPHDEGRTLTRSFSLEASVSTEETEGLPEAENVQAIFDAQPETSASLDTPYHDTASGGPPSTSNKSRFCAVTSFWECSYCLYLNQTNGVCIVCNKCLQDSKALC